MVRKSQSKGFVCTDCVQGNSGVALRAAVVVGLLLGGLAETAVGQAGNARAWGATHGQLGNGGAGATCP